MEKLVTGEFPVSVCEKLPTPEAQILYTWLLHLSTKHKECFPSIETIMRLTRMGRNRVIKNLNMLTENKLIVKKRRFNKSTIYIIRQQKDILE